MRSTLSLRRQLVRNANTKRSFTTALPRISQLSAPICQACSRRTASTNTPPRSQRRREAEAAVRVRHAFQRQRIPRRRLLRRRDRVPAGDKPGAVLQERSPRVGFSRRDPARRALSGRARVHALSWRLSPQHVRVALPAAPITPATALLPSSAVDIKSSKT